MNQPTDLQISLKKLDEHHLKIMVNLKNPPTELFGIAFHLSFSNEQWQLLTSEKGESIQGPNDQLFFLTNERKNPTHEIIFGATLNNSDRTFFREGLLVSYTLWAENAEDLKGVLTHKILQIVAHETKIDTLSKKIKPQQVFPQSQQKTETTTKFKPHDLFIKKSQPPEHSLVLTYAILFIIFIILVIIFLASNHSRHKNIGPKT